MVGEQVLCQSNQLGRRTRFQPKKDRGGLILLFSVRHAAEDQDGQTRQDFANFSHQIRTIHAGHDVVSDKQSKGCEERRIGKHGQGLLSTARCKDHGASSGKDFAAGFSLDKIVVYKQNRCFHGDNVMPYSGLSMQCGWRVPAVGCTIEQRDSTPK